MENIIIIIGTFWGFSTIAVPFIIEFIFEKIYKPSSKTWRSVMSWVIPIALTYGLWYLGLGYLQEITIWWVPAILGALSAGVANYAWNDIPWIKDLINRIIEFLPKTKKNDK